MRGWWSWAYPPHGESDAHDAVAVGEFNQHVSRACAVASGDNAAGLAMSLGLVFSEVPVVGHDNSLNQPIGQSINNVRRLMDSCILFFTYTPWRF